ncbi:MAG: hypothetical protein ABI723_04140 [Bacteroidia bacterium]
MKDELQGIISGKNPVSHGAIIQAAARYLAGSKTTSGVAKNSKLFKAEEIKILNNFISENNLWISVIPTDNFISEGVEQKVYLKDSRTVNKINSCIYYNSWVDYFHSLLLHNYFFADTAYQLEGFYFTDGNLNSVVSQPYVTATEHTNLFHVRSFMSANGFENIRNQDYYHPELGIILEDLHDENVLTENGVLRFIDTVFYLEQKFFL